MLVAVMLCVCCSGGSVEVRSSSNTASRNSIDAVNINLAAADELEKIPRIGPKLAHDIIEFREKHGPFRRPEHLMLVEGISDERFREIRDHIRVE